MSEHNEHNNMWKLKLQIIKKLFLIEEDKNVAIFEINLF